MRYNANRRLKIGKGSINKTPEKILDFSPQRLYVVDLRFGQTVYVEMETESGAKSQASGIGRQMPIGFPTVASFLSSESCLLSPRILITSGPTREYLDPVRYLTNGSSGRMGSALAEAVLKRGGVPIIVSGQTSVVYPSEAEVHWVETTEQMLEWCLELFPHCVGVIGAAAPCDFQPLTFSEQKISKPKDGGGIVLQFSATPDILAALGNIKRPDQWSMAFALETENGTARALEKLRQKRCDYIVLNGPDAIGKDEAKFQVFDAAGTLRKVFCGSKRLLAEALLRLV